MLARQPIAAGRFYSGSEAELDREARHYLQKGQKVQPGKPAWGYMLPHAGYIFCGNIIGQTLSGAQLPERLIILCPNHTGRGQPLSVWPEGAWLTPLGSVAVDKELAEEIINSGGGYAPDTLAHLGEHSIEVLLPFIQELRSDAKIVPICVGVRQPRYLAHAGAALAKVLEKPENAGIGLIVSSDMNHYENEKTTLMKDEMALKEAVASNPEGLLDIVEKEGISMCGAAPLALALYTARDMGGAEVELVAHDTSGKESGDFAHVVGYAGLRLYKKALADS